MEPHAQARNLRVLTLASAHNEGNPALLRHHGLRQSGMGNFTFPLLISLFAHNCFIGSSPKLNLTKP